MCKKIDFLTFNLGISVDVYKFTADFLSFWGENFIFPVLLYKYSICCYPSNVCEKNVPKWKNWGYYLKICKMYLLFANCKSFAIKICQKCPLRLDFSFLFENPFRYKVVQLRYWRLYSHSVYTLYMIGKWTLNEINNKPLDILRPSTPP